MQFFWILFWGGVGVSLRYFAAHLIPQTIIPWSILLVNSFGSFAAGVLAARTDLLSQYPMLTHALLIGLLGGFTTFSSYAIDTVRLVSSGLYFAAFVNFFLNNFCCLGLCFLGFRIFRIS